MSDQNPPEGAHAKEVPTGDQLVQTVIVLVATIALIALCGVIGLSVAEKPVPDVLENTLVGSVTGLLALLAGRTGS